MTGIPHAGPLLDASRTALPLPLLVGSLIGSHILHEIIASSDFS